MKFLHEEKKMSLISINSDSNVRFLLFLSPFNFIGVKCLKFNVHYMWQVKIFKQLKKYNDRHNHNIQVEDIFQNVESIQDALKSSFANNHNAHMQLSLIDFSMTNLLKS